MTYNQKQAIALAKKLVNTQTEATKIAIQIGLYLISIKKEMSVTEIRNRKFGIWIDKKMPIGQRQCQKYMRIARAKAHVLSDTSIVLMDISSEELLLTVDNKTEKYIRTLNAKKSLTRLEVKAIINEQKSKQTISSVHEITNMLLNLEYKINEEIKINSLSKQEWKEIKTRLQEVMDSI